IKTRTCPLPSKVHPLVNPQGFLGAQGLQVPYGHSGVHVAELVLWRLGVAGLGQPGQSPWTIPGA
ncbi:MAG: hypothetical protein J4N89_08020, partial [Chloroflexi bacterium]|nr:hypothetical protein [Chloroflexota bacterium]